MAWSLERWLSLADPELMLPYFWKKTRWNKRKLRLYAAACCRFIWELLPDARSRTAVETAERFADGLITPEELAVAGAAAGDANEEALALRGEGAAWAELSACYATEPFAYFAAIRVNGMVESAVAHNPTIVLGDRVALVREIFGNPFLPVAWKKQWLTSSVAGIASKVYDERAFDLMPILADSLEEAGCDDAEILAHCRGPGPHVRGCWVVDLILGRE